MSNRKLRHYKCSRCGDYLTKKSFDGTQIYCGRCGGLMTESGADIQCAPRQFIGDKAEEHQTAMDMQRPDIDKNSADYKAGYNVGHQEGYDAAFTKILSK